MQGAGAASELAPAGAAGGALSAMGHLADAALDSALPILTAQAAASKSHPAGCGLGSVCKMA